MQKVFASNAPTWALDDLNALRQARRQSLPLRVVFAALVALAFSPLSGLRICLGWFAVYTLLQVVEWWLSRRPSGMRVQLTLMNLSSWVFGGLSLTGPFLEGAWGIAVSMCLLSGGLLFTVLSSVRRFTIFLVSASPYIAYLLLMPVLALRVGATTHQAMLLAVAGGLMLLSSLLVWRSTSRAFRAEADARAAAEAADAAKSAIVAMVSHELRTPITAILAGAAQAARETSNASRAAHLSLISESGQMMRVLLGDLLDHAKIEAGRMDVETTPFDLRRLVRDMILFWRPEAQKRGLALRLEGARSLPQWVAGDPTRIRQVLNNLFSNALKFTPTGEVRLRASGVRTASGRWALQFDIVDTGAGMQREQLERLFQPFSQGAQSVARTHGGTGLGLAISRQLARLMGGDVGATSSPGVGSTFTFSLNVAPAEPPAVATPIAAPQASGLRILVADDHAVNRQAFGLLLEPVAERLVMVEDGLEAVAAARAEPFDIILLDLNMPRLGGLEAARWIRAELGPSTPARLLAVTASVAAADRAACLAAGMHGFIEKPVQAADLYAALDAALAEEPQVEPVG